jgi:hypothetical protein
VNWGPLGKLGGRSGKGGLGQSNNTVRMTGTITAPFIIGWLVIRVFLPEEYVDVATLVSFAIWMAYVLVLYSQTKSKAASYIPFPQSHWFFGDGQQINFDLFVPPKGYELIKEYLDGTMLYRVYFKDRYEYLETDRAYSDVFDRALWKLPADWKTSFHANGHGEFFFENLFVDHPSCENVEVSVIDWMEQGSTRTPICVVTGCSYFYKLAKDSRGKIRLGDEKRTMGIVDLKEVAIADLNEEVLELRNRNEYLEQEHELYVKEEPTNIKKLSDNRMERTRNRVGDIMDTGQSLWNRIVNLKMFGIILGIVICAVILSHFLLGYP